MTLTASQHLLSNVFQLFCCSLDQINCLSRIQAIESLNLNKFNNSKDSPNQHASNQEGEPPQLLRKCSSVPQVVFPNSFACKNQRTVTKQKPAKQNNQEPQKGVGCFLLLLIYFGLCGIDCLSSTKETGVLHLPQYEGQQ